MVVGDDYPGTLKVSEHVSRHHFSAGVVAIRVFGLEHAQPVFDRDAWSHYQETPSEAPAVRVPDGVDGLPCDDHGHDGGLAGAGGQLQRQARQLRVGVVIGVGEAVEETPSDLPGLGGNLSQPDGRLDSLYLAEEGLDVAEVVVSPMLEQTSGLGRDAPVVGVAQLSPLVDLTANLIHHRRDVVLLLLRGQPLALIDDECLLMLIRPSLPGLWDGGDELRAAPVLDDLLGRLTLIIELPVLSRVVVGGVEYGLFEEAIHHELPQTTLWHSHVGEVE